jgi:hypothetical protein
MIRIAQETLNLLGSPSLAHESLLGLAQRGLPYQLDQLLGSRPRALVFFTLAWIALWILDRFYYHRLLEGAVKAILELERATQNNSHETPIRLSTIIDAEVPNRIKTFTWFYGLVLLGLLVGVGCTGWQVCTWTAPEHAASEYRIQLVNPEKLKEALAPQKPPANQKETGQ